MDRMITLIRYGSITLCCVGILSKTGSGNSSLLTEASQYLISWNNVDLLAIEICGIHLSSLHKELNISISKISFKSHVYNYSLIFTWSMTNR